MARIYHWVTGPQITDYKPYIIEPVDHPLSPVFEYEPVNAVNKYKNVEQIYNSKNCKKIILVSEGQRLLFKKYFPNHINKVVVVHPGINIKQTDAEIIKKLRYEKTINFLCIASDYWSKGVDLIINAFANVDLSEHAHLILVCNNIPEIVKSSLPKNIELVSMPGTSANSKKIKDKLYSRAQVCIVFSHTDTTAALMEALSYGLPLITLRNQHTKDFVSNNNGYEIDVPFYLYDAGYGYKWKTMSEYYKLLEQAKARGDFDTVISELSDKVRLLINDVRLIEKMSINSCILARDSFSIRRRNIQLNNIYIECLEN
jgi:glycosyltransferase involved in cell wall biosynthesis